jgi:hypothetical protein
MMEAGWNQGIDDCRPQPQVGAEQMKQDPFLEAVEGRMRRGFITKEGFLGKDTRQLVEILIEDEAAVNRLGLANEEVAQRLRYFLEKAREGLGTEVLVEGKFLVSADDVRGRLPCPWGHRGLYPKTNVRLRNIENNMEIVFTGLQIHMIAAHGFYEGKGSAFRLEPDVLKEALDL